MCAAQEDPDKDYEKKDRRREEERRRKAARSGFVRDLVQELEGAPEEVTTPRVCLLFTVRALCALVLKILKRASASDIRTWHALLRTECVLEEDRRSSLQCLRTELMLLGAGADRRRGDGQPAAGQGASGSKGRAGGGAHGAGALEQD